MSFLQPLFLLGLLAGAIPLLIHLYNRREGVVRPFPAMALLMESHERTARSARVRQRVLMVLRVLVLVVLALAMARPFVFSERGVVAGDRMPTATVIVLDNSASMRHEGWWDAAKEAVEARLDRLRPWDEVAILDTTTLDSPASRPGGDHDAVRRVLEGMEPGAGRAALPDAITRAAERLGASSLDRRRIVVVSDFAAGGFPTTPPEDAGLPYPIERVSVRGTKQRDPDNVAITDVTYTQEGSARTPAWRVEVELQNTATRPIKDVQVRLSLDGQMIGAGKVPEIAPGTSVRHTFRHRFAKRGTFAGIASLDWGDTPGRPDHYAADDTFHFTFRTRDRVRVLLVNGETSALAHEDELFFLTRALNPRREGDPTIVQQSIGAERLADPKLALARYDVIVLANVARVAPATVERLERYVRGGGGLMFTMGDQVDVRAMNKNLSALLPKPLRGLKRLAGVGDPDAPVKITHPGPMRGEHPVFRAFDTTGGGSLQAAGVYSYMQLEPSMPEESTILLSFKNGAPALIERRVGQGRVLLWTTTIDNEWTDIPIRAAYLPLTQRAVMFLARRATSQGTTRPIAGQRMRLEVSGLARERVIIKGPTHAKDPVRLVLEPDRGVVSFTPTRAGTYTVWAETDEPAKDGTPRNRLDALTFSVNADREESRLAALPSGALDPWRAPEERVSTPGTSGASGAARVPRSARRRINLWPKLLFIITVLLLLETVVGVRQRVFVRLARRLRGQPEVFVE